MNRKLKMPTVIPVANGFRCRKRNDGIKEFNVPLKDLPYSEGSHVDISELAPKELETQEELLAITDQIRNDDHEVYRVSIPRRLYRQLRESGVLGQKFPNRSIKDGHVAKIEKDFILGKEGEYVFTVCDGEMNQADGWHRDIATENLSKKRSPLLREDDRIYLALTGCSDQKDHEEVLDRYNLGRLNWSAPDHSTHPSSGINLCVKRMSELAKLGEDGGLVQTKSAQGAKTRTWGMSPGQSMHLLAVILAVEAKDPSPEGVQKSIKNDVPKYRAKNVIVEISEGTEKKAIKALKIIKETVESLASDLDRDGPRLRALKSIVTSVSFMRCAMLAILEKGGAESFPKNFAKRMKKGSYDLLKKRVLAAGKTPSKDTALLKLFTTTPRKQSTSEVPKAPRKSRAKKS